MLINKSAIEEHQRVINNIFKLPFFSLNFQDGLAYVCISYHHHAKMIQITLLNMFNISTLP